MKASNLAILSGGHIVYIDRLDSTHALGLSAKIARRSPVHCTALGKAILAYLPHAQVCAILTQYGMPTLTEHTLTDPDPFVTFPVDWITWTTDHSRRSGTEGQA